MWSLLLIGGQGGDWRGDGAPSPSPWSRRKTFLSREQWFVGFSEVDTARAARILHRESLPIKTPLMSLPRVAEVEEMHRAPGEITLCSDLLLVSGRRRHSADVATINILQTHAPNRSRADHIRSCGARWYVHSLNNRSQNTTSHLARLSISERRCRALPPTFSFTADSLVLTSL